MPSGVDQGSWARQEKLAAALHESIEAYFAEQFDYQYRIRGDNGLGISKNTAVREARDYTQRICDAAIKSAEREVFQ